MSAINLVLTPSRTAVFLLCFCLPKAKYNNKISIVSLLVQVAFLCFLVKKETEAALVSLHGAASIIVDLVVKRLTERQCVDSVLEQWIKCKFPHVCRSFLSYHSIKQQGFFFFGDAWGISVISHDGELVIKRKTCNGHFRSGQVNRS